MNDFRVFSVEELFDLLSVTAAGGVTVSCVNAEHNINGEMSDEVKDGVKFGV